MFRTIIGRSFHSQVALCVAKTEKSALARLRSKTGYTISNCKKALVLHNDDYDKALAWLNEQAQKEGWNKAEKLQGRLTVQGLIGVFAENNAATLVEVNCETDFVARNKEFVNLLSSVTRLCHSHNLKNLPASSDSCVKHVGNCEQLLKTACTSQGNKTLSDIIALKIGLLGENMTLRRALSLKVADSLHFGCYSHPVATESNEKSDNFLYGKYGAVVAYRKSETESLTKLTEQQCGRQLAQHIIGMNPKIIGPPFIREATEVPLEEKESSEQALDSDSEEVTTSTIKDDEVRMLYQEFLADPSLTVGDFANQNGIEILDFVRFECGEDLSTD